MKVTTDSGTKSIFVYLGPSPNFTGCPANTWVPSGDLLEPGKTIDTSQLTGGTFYHEYSAALVMFGTLPVTGIQLVSDSGYAFGDGEQTVMVDNTFINSDTYTYNDACTQVDASGLAGFWKFDEAAGLVSIDSAGADNNGANENGPAYVPGNPVVQPNVTALQFDGTDDQVRAANSADFNFGTSSFTVSLFSKTGSGSGDRSVLGNFSAAQKGWGLYYYANGGVDFFGYGTLGSNDVAQQAPGLLDNRWHHVVGVFNHSGSSLTISTYYDGMLMGSSTSNVGDLTANSDLLLGHYLGQPHYQGTLDDVRVYDRALSAGEIQSLNNGCGDAASSSSSSSMSSSSSSMSSSSSSMSSSSSSVSSSSSSSTSSSSSSANPAPMCNGQSATIWVNGSNVIVGGPDAGDTYSGELDGTSGNDVLCGLSGSDEIKGGSGNDWISGGDGADDIDGGSNNDTIDGGMDPDVLDGGSGDDFLSGSAGADEAEGGSGADVMCGGAAADHLEGGLGNDRIDGGAGSDTLEGKSGTDICRNGESLSTCENTTTNVPECAGL